MANQTSPQTASGRTYTNPPLSADPGRYSFLNLNNAEPNLYLPAKGINPTNTLYTLLSDPLTGGRYWSNNTISVDKNTNFTGFGTDEPNNRVSVVGNISATGYIYGTIYSPGVILAAGLNTQVQYNSFGNLSGDYGFEYFQALSAIVVGGGGNYTYGLQSSILGGTNNVIQGNLAGIVGGSGNTAFGTGGFIGGGKQNQENGDYTVIAGGRQNITNDTYAAIGGGFGNINNSLAGVIAGGQNNTLNASTVYNGILGGQNNIVGHNNSFILGSNITTLSSNFTYVNNMEVTGQLITDGMVAEGLQTVSTSLSVVNIDLLSATTFNINLTGNVLSFNILNNIYNKVNSFTVYTIQDAIGGHRITWNFNGNSVKWAGGLAPQPTLSANAVDIYTFISNNGGNSWYGFIAGQNFS